jgi:hypothetical protein
MTGRAEQVSASLSQILRAESDTPGNQRSLRKVVIPGGWPPADLSEIQTQRKSLKGIHLHFYNQI